MKVTYEPGDIANGHVLGDDNQWHSIPPKQHDAEAERRAGMKVIKIGGAILGSVLALAFVIDAIEGDAQSSAPTPVAEQTQTEQAPPAPTDPIQSLEAAIAEDLGDLNRGDQGAAFTGVDYDEATQTMTVTHRLNDNLFHDAITGAGWNDAGAIIEAVNASGIPVQELKIVGTFGFIDAYGKDLGEKPAMTTTWSAETLQQIQPANLTDEGMEALAGSVSIHPDLQPR